MEIMTVKMTIKEIDLEGEELGLTKQRRPSDCRQRLYDEGKDHPKSGCKVCHNGGLFGCIFEKQIPEGVYFTNGNFYGMETRTGLGNDFYMRWKDRMSEFPNAPKFKHHDQLDYSKPDSKDYIPDTTMIEKSYFHPKTRRVYKVDGFIWDSDLDRWKVSYNRDGCITAFARLPEVFAEKFIEIAK